MSTNSGYLQKDYSVTLSLNTVCFSVRVFLFVRLVGFMFVFGWLVCFGLLRFAFKLKCSDKKQLTITVKLAICDCRQCNLVLDS